MRNIREDDLAFIIDGLYLEMKDGFCDYENKTHKLGFFKERIKQEVDKFLTSKEDEL